MNVFYYQQQHRFKSDESVKTTPLVLSKEVLHTGFNKMAH